MNVYVSLLQKWVGSEIETVPFYKLLSTLFCHGVRN